MTEGDEQKQPSEAVRITGKPIKEIGGQVKTKPVNDPTMETRPKAPGGSGSSGDGSSGDGGSGDGGSGDGGSGDSK